MPIYDGRRKNTYRVTLWNAAEKRQQEWTVEGTKRDARSFLRKQEEKLEQGLLVAKSRAVPTFSDFCAERYTPHAKSRLRARTWATARVYQVATLVQHFERIKMDGSWTTEIVDEFKRARIEEDKCLPGTVNRDLTVLKTILRFARESCKLPVPALKIEMMKRGKRRVRTWSTEEAARLYVAAREVDERMLDILHFLFDTGCRKGESVAAEWSWVDWDAKLLRIPVTDYWQPKNGKPREVPLSDALLARLQALPKNGDHVFLSALGKPYGTFPDAGWRKVRKAAKVTGNVHMTRHTFASHFLKVRPDLFLLAGVLGHSATKVTELYAHLLPEHMDRARNAVQLAPPAP